MGLFEGVDLGDDFPKSPVNPDYYPGDVDEEEHGDYENLDDKKKKEEIRKLQISNEKELNNLISKELVTAILAEVGHSIQTSFVDMARRESPGLAAELGISNLERDLEKKLSDLIKSGIESVQNNIKKLSDNGVFE